MQQVSSQDAPLAIGPYSQAIIAGDYIFCSGQISLDPASGELVGETIEEQTARVINNLEAVLKEAGSDLSRVVKTEVYLQDMNDFQAMNEVYASRFTSDPKPARVTVEVSRLPKGAKIEVACVALL